MQNRNRDKSWKNHDWKKQRKKEITSNQHGYMQIQNTMKQARIIIVIIIIIIFSIFFNIRSLLSKTYEPNIAILM